MACFNSPFRFALRPALVIVWGLLGTALAGCGFYQDWRDKNKGIQLNSLTSVPG